MVTLKALGATLVAVSALVLLLWVAPPALREHQARTAVREMLKDPGSAQFTDVQWRRDHFVTCGFVNAKNAFGAYVGRQPFIAYPSGAVDMAQGASSNDAEEAHLREAFANLWKAHCS